ncbi:MAG: hypothetical protein ACYDBQ_00495 [Thermoplasmatota archaeon]
MRLPALALLLALALCSPALAQHSHPMGSGIVVSHDVPDDGRTYVGDVSHFGILDLGNDLVPDFHQQNHIRVTENGVVLFETTPDSGHNYAGVNTFDVAFPATGNYTVQAIGPDGMALASFSGCVVAPAPGHATLHVDAPESVTAGTPAHFGVETDGPAGLVDHSDSLFEVRQGDLLLFRTHLHSHTTAQSLNYTFVEPGTYTVRVFSFLSFPSAKATPFPVQVVEKTVTVSPGLAAPAGVATPMVQAMNAVANGTASGGNYSLLGTFDPYTVVGPTTEQHLDLLVMDPATHHPVPHVDFSARITGPTGNTLFESSSLHEYDGILELTAVEPIPGSYHLHATASRSPWTGVIDMDWRVVPPAEPVAVDVPPAPALGIELVSTSGLDGLKAGVPANLTLQVANLAGLPLPHSEIEVQVVDGSGAPILDTKLHTHDGTFKAILTAPAAGLYTLRLSPFPTEAQPVVFNGAQVGAPLDVAFQVASGPGVPQVGSALGLHQNALQSPGLGWGVALLLVALALVRRR